MAVVSIAEVQQWLEQTKLTLAEVDVELEATAREITFSRVAAYYDTSTWDDDTSTPSLIRKVISLYVAAWEYMRAYSESLEIDGTNWGQKLENMAATILDGIVAGTLDLGGIVPILVSGQPEFYPKDSSVDSEGRPVEAAFTMGQVF